MDNLILLIDLDGTLKTEHDDNGPYEEPSITVQSGSKTYVFAKRPYVDEFLDFVSQIATRTVLCTAGGGGYARRVIKAMNIEKYFTDIIAAEDFQKGFQMKQNWKCIFIDNNQEMVTLKVNRLSSNQLNRNCDKHTWVIDTYHGKKEDNILLEVIEELKKL